MAALNGLRIIFGGATFMSSSADEVSAWLKTIEELGVSVIDTAQAYGVSEEALGEAGAASKFVLDTKSSTCFGPQPSTKEVVIKSAKESLQKLKTDAVDVYYLHAPDRRVPWKDTLSGLNELHQQGAFKRLGLSNFLAHEVEEVISIAKENNFVVPSVYQGNYSAVARRTEAEVFPTLRKHNIAFYAYSPIAGGFLSKSKAELTDPAGRFGQSTPLGQIYNGMYNRPSFLAALDAWDQIAKDEGITKAELAYRWVVYHSKLDAKHGDAVIVGSRNEQQFRETMAGIKKGPLSDEAVKKVDGIWESVKAEAQLDNFEMLSK